MEFALLPVEKGELKEYKDIAQEAFQKGFEAKFGQTDTVILPEKDLDNALNQKGAIAYKAMIDGEMVGGAIIATDAATQWGHLDFLFIKYGVQSRGIGKAIWFEIEKKHPEIKKWEAYTPYFEKRNIHFYVNVCGFHITAFYHEKYPMPNPPEDFHGDGEESMFLFEKDLR